MGTPTIRLDEELEADLERLAKQQKRTKSELVRDGGWGPTVKSGLPDRRGLFPGFLVKIFLDTNVLLSAFFGITHTKLNRIQVT